MFFTVSCVCLRFNELPSGNFPPEVEFSYALPCAAPPRSECICNACSPRLMLVVIVLAGMAGGSTERRSPSANRKELERWWTAMGEHKELGEYMQLFGAVQGRCAEMDSNVSSKT